MAFSPAIAAIRFGTGLSASRELPSDPDSLITEVSGTDQARINHPVTPFQDHLPTVVEALKLRKQRRQNRNTNAGREAQRGLARIRREAKREQARNFGTTLVRAMTADFGFRERLSWFWADHFTARGKGMTLQFLTSSYVEEAIRPHIGGRFADLLKAAVLHPVMLAYLDQIRSVGPNSLLARGGRGLNENLAREVLELHSIGVSGSYTQTDVTELAELFAGLSFAPSTGFRFRERAGEPGPETVLGRSYGGARPRLVDIFAFLEDLAVNQDTAKHIARKLAIHFVADVPDQGLVDHVASVFVASGGRLTDTYSALLEHPAAGLDVAQKIRQPVEFIAASLRVLDIEPARIIQAQPKEIAAYLGAPMALMGQRWEMAAGPDGWPEEAAAWVTPQGIAARIQWAMTVPRILRQDLPDPRELVRDAFGMLSSAALKFAATNAATRWEGVGLVLSAPEFQRR